MLSTYFRCVCFPHLSPISSKILSAPRARSSPSLVSPVSPAAQSSGSKEQALELLYLNSQSTNTHGLQGEAVQNPSHFLMSAALTYHRFLRESGQGRGPRALAETPPALGCMTQTKEEPSLPPHLTQSHSQLGRHTEIQPNKPQTHHLEGQSVTVLLTQRCQKGQSLAQRGRESRKIN